MSLVSMKEMAQGYDLGDPSERELDGDAFASAAEFDGMTIMPDGFHRVGAKSLGSAGMTGTTEFDGMDHLDVIRVLAKRANESRLTNSRGTKDPKRVIGQAKARLMRDAAAVLSQLRGAELEMAITMWTASGEELPREFKALQARRHARRLARNIREALDAELVNINFKELVQNAPAKKAPKRRRNRRRHSARRQAKAA